MRSPLDTDRIKLTRELKARLQEQCSPNGHGCVIFTLERKRHIEVEVYSSDKRHLASVQRISYALANPKDHVGVEEMVVTLCGQHGDHNGNGACVNPQHLIKVPTPEARHYIACVRSQA